MSKAFEQLKKDFETISKDPKFLASFDKMKALQKENEDIKKSMAEKAIKGESIDDLKYIYNLNEKYIQMYLDKMTNKIMLDTVDKFLES